MEGPEFLEYWLLLFVWGHAQIVFVWPIVLAHPGVDLLTMKVVVVVAPIILSFCYVMFLPGDCHCNLGESARFHSSI